MSDELIRKYKTHLKSLGPLKVSKFTGQEKMQAGISPEAEAEKRAYRLPNGNLGFPSKWLAGAIINAAAGIAPNKQKMKDQQAVARRIRVEPMMGDLGIKDYKIDTAVVMNRPTPSKSTVDFVSKPRLDDWEVEMFLVTTLPKDKLRALLDYAGTDVGVGSDTRHGYGQFKVTSLTEVTK